MRLLDLQQPLDRWVAALSLVSATLIGILLFLEFYAPPFVEDFNGSVGLITARQSQLVLKFNRPMDFDSVSQNFQITPQLPGQFFSSGRRLVYSLEHPARYGQRYSVAIDDAVDYQGRVMQDPFQSTFSTPEPRYLGLGVQGDLASRLLLKNLVDGSTETLSIDELKVTQFRVTAKGSDFPIVYYFGSLGSVQEQDLYQISLESRQTSLILDHADSQNLRFQTSPDGNIVVVERINPNNPIQTQLWIRRSPRDRFERLDLGSTLIGDFLVTPDNSSLIVAQGQGLAILPLNDQVQEDYLPQFGQILTLKSDGSVAAMVTYNQDFTRSLWVLSNSGHREEIYKTQGSLLAAQFDPTRPTVYTLTTQVSELDYTESPRLIAINVDTGEWTDLVAVDFPAELAFSVSPDGHQLLYSVMRPSNGIPAAELPLSRTGQPIVESEVWALDLDTQDYTKFRVDPGMANVQWIP